MRPLVLFALLFGCAHAGPDVWTVPTEAQAEESCSRQSERSVTSCAWEERTKVRLHNREEKLRWLSYKMAMRNGNPPLDPAEAGVFYCHDDADCGPDKVCLKVLPRSCASRAACPLPVTEHNVGVSREQLGDCE